MVMKHYPVQFKADAVALYRSRPGATIAQIADDLGINRETLRSWVRADDPGQKLPRPARLCAMFCVHPTRQHTNPQPVLEGPMLSVSPGHAKVRRDGYRTVPA